MIIIYVFVSKSHTLHIRHSNLIHHLCEKNKRQLMLFQPARVSASLRVNLSSSLDTWLSNFHAVFFFLSLLWTDMDVSGHTSLMPGFGCGGRLSELDVWGGMCLTKHSFLLHATAEWLPEQMIGTSLLLSLHSYSTEVGFWRTSLFFFWPTLHFTFCSKHFRRLIFHL